MSFIPIHPAICVQRDFAGCRKIDATPVTAPSSVYARICGANARSGWGDRRFPIVRHFGLLYQRITADRRSWDA
jgi:hypothetical protein